MVVVVVVVVVVVALPNTGAHTCAQNLCVAAMRAVATITVATSSAVLQSACERACTYKYVRHGGVSCCMTERRALSDPDSCGAPSVVTQFRLLAVRTLASVPCRYVAVTSLVQGCGVSFGNKDPPRSAYCELRPADVM